MYESKEYVNMLAHANKGLISPLMAWEFVPFREIEKENSWIKDFFHLKNLSGKFDWQINLSTLKNILKVGKKALVITNVKQQFIYASEHFETMTGFKRDAVMGKTPKLFQGPATDLRELERVGKLIKEHNSVSTILNNYKKDGTLYQCKIEIQPIHNRDKKVVSYMAIEEEF
jgi:PAS domain S-box-containing protein